MIIKKKLFVKLFIFLIFLIVFSFLLNLNFINNKENGLKIKKSPNFEDSTSVIERIGKKDFKTKLLVKDNIYLSKKNDNQNENDKEINKFKNYYKNKSYKDKDNNKDNENNIYNGNINNNKINNINDINNYYNINIKNFSKKFLFKNHLEKLEEIVKTKQGNCIHVDIVYTWVNGSDPKHIKSKQKERGEEDFEPHRFRDYGSLKYSLRSVAKYAPWVNNIYIITANQIPTWFNTSNSGNIKFIFHEDYYKNKSHLPTFNSNSIESNFHNLPNEVSNCFLYLNDDVFFREPVEREDYFDIFGNQKIYERSNEYIGSEYLKEIQDDYSNQFIYTNIELNKIWNEVKPRTWPDHGVQVFKKTIWSLMYKQFYKQLEKTSSNKFRTTRDTPVSFIYNQFAKKFYSIRIAGYKTTIAPNNMNMYIGVWNDIENNETVTKNAMDMILNYNLSSSSSSSSPRVLTVCLNDGYDYLDNQLSSLILNMFETLFPDKQSYEKK